MTQKEDSTSNNAALGVVKELILIAKDDPDTKSAAKNIASIANIVTGTLQRAVIPLAAINYGIDKFANYMKTKFQDDMASRTLKISPENVIDPKAFIAGPVLQGLVYTHDIDSLKDMYLNLLASAMNSNTANEAHPSYVEIIKQLTGEEAKLLKIFLADDRLPVAKLRLIVNDRNEYIDIANHIVNLNDSNTDSAITIKMMPAYIENWIRLGLIEVDYTAHQADEKAYDWVKNRPEYIDYYIAKANDGDFQPKLDIVKGLIVRTKYGEIFGKIVGISS